MADQNWRVVQDFFAKTPTAIAQMSVEFAQGMSSGVVQVELSVRSTAVAMQLATTGVVHQDSLLPGEVLA